MADEKQILYVVSWADQTAVFTNTADFAVGVGIAMLRDIDPATLVFRPNIPIINPDDINLRGACGPPNTTINKIERDYGNYVFDPRDLITGGVELTDDSDPNWAKVLSERDPGHFYVDHNPPEADQMILKLTSQQLEGFKYGWTHILAKSAKHFSVYPRDDMSIV